jgi:hypothetical protein
VWTDRLILSLKDTLKKKHVVVDDQASKVLKIAIEKAGIKTKAGGWAVDCSLEWKVQPGNGAMIPMAVVTGHWKYQDASNVGVRNACLMILQDEQVQSYLRGR